MFNLKSIDFFFISFDGKSLFFFSIRWLPYDFQGFKF